MRLLIATISVILTFVSCPALVVAQNGTDAPTTNNQLGITASLNLTKEQEFQIIVIITTTQIAAEPLRQTFDEIDQELVAASFADTFDEERVRALSEQEATILSQLIALKVFAKAKIYQILTPEQRKLLQQFRRKAQLQGNPGSISIY